ncbi:hypothetical protein DL96DRAFT_1564637 [Flagelloscypha sp. PMI_526]|nr:hypothetical protein DL96DRAFT_1564637 [Flagelloscypha sp. PMI_526]
MPGSSLHYDYSVHRACFVAISQQTGREAMISLYQIKVAPKTSNEKLVLTSKCQRVEATTNTVTVTKNACTVVVAQNGRVPVACSQSGEENQVWAGSLFILCEVTAFLSLLLYASVFQSNGKGVSTSSGKTEFVKRFTHLRTNTEKAKIRLAASVNHLDRDGVQPTHCRIKSSQRFLLVSNTLLSRLLECLTSSISNFRRYPMSLLTYDQAHKCPTLGPASLPPPFFGFPDVEYELCSLLRPQRYCGTRVLPDESALWEPEEDLGCSFPSIF